MMLPSGNAQDWTLNSDFNAELKYSADNKPFANGRVTHFRPIGYVAAWVYDSKTNILFGAQPNSFKSEDGNQIVRYRVSDNTILEPIRGVKNVQQLVIKNRKLVACCRPSKTCSLAIFDLDTNKQLSDIETDFTRVTHLFCSQADNNFVYIFDKRKRGIISQFDIAQGKVTNTLESKDWTPGTSISPDGKWLGMSRQTASFDEVEMKAEKPFKSPKIGKIVAKTSFQNWAIREEGAKENVPTPLHSRKDGASFKSCALHPSKNLFAEGYFAKDKDRSGKIYFRFGIRFSNFKYDNTIASLILSVPPEKTRLERGYNVSGYNDAVQEPKLSTTTFDEEDKLAVTTIGPHAYVIHLNPTILEAKAVPPPPKLEIVDSGAGNHFACPGEKISFDVKITENATGEIQILNAPEDLTFENGIVNWTPTQADIGVYRIIFRATANKQSLRHETVLTVMPQYLDLKGRIFASVKSFNESKIAYFTDRGQLKFLVVVDTASRKIVQEFKADGISEFSLRNANSMAINEDYVFAKSDSRLLLRFDIQTGKKKSVVTDQLDSIESMYLDQLGRLVISGHIPKKQFDRALVLDAGSLEIIEDDVRTGLLATNNLHLLTLGPVTDTVEQPPRRKLVRHFGSIVDLDQNKYVSLSHTGTNPTSLPRRYRCAAIGFTLPFKGEQESNLPFRNPNLPRWWRNNHTKDFSRPLRIQHTHHRYPRQHDANGFSPRGSDFVLSSLVGNHVLKMPAFGFDDRRAQTSLDSSTKKNLSVIKQFPGGDYDRFTEIAGDDIFLASGSRIILFHRLPKEFLNQLRYPLSLVDPEVVQIHLNKKRTIQLQAIGAQSEVEFSLGRKYQHLGIDKDTGLLTIDGSGIQDAWLDANFPLRLAKKELEQEELERTLRWAQNLAKGKLNYDRFTGVPSPTGFFPVRLSFQARVKNLEKLEQIKDRRNSIHTFDINAHATYITIIGLIDEKVIVQEIAKVLQALNN